MCPWCLPPTLVAPPAPQLNLVARTYSTHDLHSGSGGTSIWNRVRYRTNNQQPATSAPSSFQGTSPETTCASSLDDADASDSRMCMRRPDTVDIRIATARWVFVTGAASVCADRKSALWRCDPVCPPPFPHAHSGGTTCLPLTDNVAAVLSLVSFRPLISSDLVISRHPLYAS